MYHMENLNKDPEQKRGRGRPKKNLMGNNHEKKRKINDNINNTHIKEASLSKAKDEIILYFPSITLSDINYKKDNSESVENKISPHDIFTINEGNTSSKSDSDYDTNQESNNILVTELKQKITEQKYTINTLNEEIEKYKLLLSKNDLPCRNVTKMNVFLVDIVSGECIIPESTSIACGHCSHNFNDVQCVLPEYIYDDKWHVGGCYCCVECAAADSFSRNDADVWNRLSLLKDLYKVDVIIPTPDRRIFKKFGGPVDYDVYKNNIHKCDRNYRLIMPPMASIIASTEQTTLDPTRVSISMSDLKHNAKLKRSKPLMGAKDNIFSYYT